MNGRRPCSLCGGPKGPGAGQRYCPPCSEARRIRRLHRNRGVRGLMLMPRYGISIEEYDAMLDAQGGVCAICRQHPPTGRILKFAVDHDHTTGEIRGLVCQRCNMALHFLENAAWRASAERYLDDPPARVLVGTERCAPILGEREQQAA